jgi:hypothetical protein
MSTIDLRTCKPGATLRTRCGEIGTYLEHAANRTQPGRNHWVQIPTALCWYCDDGRLADHDIMPSDIVEIVAVASAAKWTAERPADPGYYWMRDKSDPLEEWLVLWAPNPSQLEFGKWVGVGFSGRHYAIKNHEFWSARIESPSTKP